MFGIIAARVGRYRRVTGTAVDPGSGCNRSHSGSLICEQPSAAGLPFGVGCETRTRGASVRHRKQTGGRPPVCSVRLWEAT